MKQLANWFATHRIIWTVSTIFLSSNAIAQNSCDEMLEEIDAVSGAVPKFESGRLASVSMYGEGTFTSPKRSLIANARAQAELQAKSSLSSFFETQLQQGSLYQSLVDSSEVTSEAGITEGEAIELRRTTSFISENTSAVLKGIVKLDECVDTEEKFVLVRMGWKPDFVEQISQTHRDISSSESTSDNVNNSNRDLQSPGIKYIEVNSTGFGQSYDDAIRSALRYAISQVFGEAIASSQAVTTQIDSIELSDSDNDSYGISAEGRSVSTTNVSISSGTIHKYEIIDITETNDGYEASLRVVLADYESGIDTTKQNIVVLPTLSNDNHHEIADSVQRRLEQALVKSQKFNLLDREFLDSAERELGFIASGNSPVEELSRLGNQIGADLLVITEITNYVIDERERRVGDRIMTRSELNAEVRLKIINPATTQIIVSELITIERQRVPKPSLSKYASIISRRLSAQVLGAQATREKKVAPPDVSEAKKRAMERQKKLEKEHEDDW